MTAWKVTRWGTIAHGFCFFPSLDSPRKMYQDNEEPNELRLLFS